MAPAQWHFADSHPVTAAADLPSKKILVVDDNLVILKALSLALAAKGYQVFTATDGSEAFSLARREKPGLILLDIFFPPDIAQGGMTWDAFLIIQWFRRMGVAESTPIIVISGAEPEKFGGRCLEAGAQAFFHKPLDMPRLLNTIAGIFSRPAETEAPALAVNFEV